MYSRSNNLSNVFSIIANHKLTLKSLPTHLSDFQNVLLIPSSNTNYLQNEPLRRIISLAEGDPKFDEGLFQYFISFFYLSFFFLKIVIRNIPLLL